LVVDPDDEWRKLASEVMRRAGYVPLEAETGEEALETARRELPAVVVVEVSLPGICGYELCRELREVLGETLGIVFVSGTRTESFDRIGGLMIGADDYLVKPFAADELLARVRRLVPRAARPTSGIASGLTPKEREVLQLLAQGLDQRQIANRLSISPSTVGTHLEHIYGKLGVRSQAQAVALAYQNDLVDRLDSLALIPLPFPVVHFFSEWLDTFCVALPG
jgi:DNA-binding NarL/FixJ family response regulator